MARLWTDGFEFQDMYGYCTDGNGTAHTVISTTFKRSGAASARLITTSTTESAWFYKNIDPVSEFYLRFGIMMDDAKNIPRIMWRSGNSTFGYLTFGTCFNINIYNNGVLVDTGLTTIYEDVWYLIEVHVKINTSTGIIEAKLDGNSVIEASFSGNTGTGTVDNIYFDKPTGALGDLTYAYIDDVALNDTTGGVDDSWCGEGKIIVMMPNDDSAPLELTPSAAVHHHLLVDELPADGDATYVEGSVVNEEDMYKLTPSGLVDVDINRVWVESRTRKTTAVDGHVALVLKAAGGAEEASSDIELLTTYSVKVEGSEFLENPVDSNPWEVADIDLIEIGPRTR